MKKFVLFTIGFTQPTPDIMDSWTKWFKSIEDKIVDQVGLRNGKEVTNNDITELSMDKDAITGYLVIKAKNIDEAIKIAQSGPMITSTKLYEVITRE
jgi:D-arabinose 1-dehydrogenase-like Zn-dependent alcohol dehydrogenase